MDDGGSRGRGAVDVALAVGFALLAGGVLFGISRWLGHLVPGLGLLLGWGAVKAAVLGSAGLTTLFAWYRARRRAD
ncbi:hypothetical protein [Kitasatospora camelliae]|uniref:Uncharacterized protein n=1 Tax=Kitasatospora camelliae TaxID=3156397 RepID=A0AAU8K187_9ACTN